MILVLRTLQDRRLNRRKKKLDQLLRILFYSTYVDIHENICHDEQDIKIHRKGLHCLSIATSRCFSELPGKAREVAIGCLFEYFFTLNDRRASKWNRGLPFEVRVKSRKNEKKKGLLEKKC